MPIRLADVKITNEILIPFIKDEINSISEPSFTADKLASNPIEFIARVTMVAATGIAITLPVLRIKLMNPITEL